MFLLVFRSIVSLLAKQMVLLEKQISTEEKPATNNLIENNSELKTIFVIFTAIFVFLIFFISFLSIYFYCKCTKILSQFAEFSSSLFFILSLLNYKIPNYEELKKNFENNVKLTKDPQNFELKKLFNKTVNFSNNESPLEIINSQKVTTPTGAIPKSILKTNSSTAIYNIENENVVDEVERTQENSENKKESTFVNTKKENPKNYIEFTADVHKISETQV